MEDKRESTFGILCFIISWKVKMQFKCKKKKKIRAMYRKDAVIDHKCQKLFSKFCAGDFSLDNAPWPGTRWSLQWSNRDISWEIAGILKISKSSIENHLHQFGYVPHSEVWVPQKLSEKKTSWPYLNLSAMWETWVQSLDWGNLLEKGKAIHSNILA